MRGLWSEREREIEASLVRALGRDPADYLAGIETIGSRRVRLVRLTEDGDRIVEEHEVPEGWEPPGAPEPTTVGDLRFSQVGRRIRIVDVDTVIEGPLRDLRAETDRIPTPSAADPHGWAPGRVTITVTIGGWSTSALPPSTPAWWLDTPR